MGHRMDNLSNDLSRMAPDQVVSCPRKDSNLRTRFRKPTLYPLSYGGGDLELPGRGHERLAAACTS